MASVATPPLPPEVASQMAPQQQGVAQAATAAAAMPSAGTVSTEGIQATQAVIGQLKDLTAKVYTQVTTIAPELKTYLAPIITAVAGLDDALTAMAQRSQGAVAAGPPGAPPASAPGAPNAGSVLANGGAGQ